MMMMLVHVMTKKEASAKQHHASTAYTNDDDDEEEASISVATSYEKFDCDDIDRWMSDCLLILLVAACFNGFFCCGFSINLDVFGGFVSISLLPLGRSSVSCYYYCFCYYSYYYCYRVNIHK